MSNVNFMSYATTSVTTSAYVTLVASVPGNYSKILICDTSGQVLKIATGTAGNEVDLCTTPLSACMDLQVFPVLIKGTRLSIKALNATVSSGYITVSFLQ